MGAAGAESGYSMPVPAGGGAVIHPRKARQAFAVLARTDGQPWAVRLLLTGEGPGDAGDCACVPVQIDLSPERAELLAQELMQSAHLARRPGSVLE